MFGACKIYQQHWPTGSYIQADCLWPPSPLTSQPLWAPNSISKFALVVPDSVNQLNTGTFWLNSCIFFLHINESNWGKKLSVFCHGYNRHFSTGLLISIIHGVYLKLRMVHFYPKIDISKSGAWTAVLFTNTKDNSKVQQELGTTDSGV